MTKITEKELIDIVLTVANRISLDVHLAMILIKQRDEGSIIHTLFEFFVLEELQKRYPELDWIHPANNSGIPDFWSNILNDGIELKCAKIWKGSTSPTFSNGKLSIEIKNKYENFLFVEFHLEDIENSNNRNLIIDNIWYGNLRYDDWTEKPSNGDLTIGIKKLNKLTKHIYSRKIDGIH